MSDTWNLDALYRGFDDPKYAADMQRMEQGLERYKDTVRAIRDGGAPLTAEQLAGLLEQEEALWCVGADLHKFTQMRQSADAGDAAAAANMAHLLDKIGTVAPFVAQVKRWVCEMELPEPAQQPQILQDYAFYLGQVRAEGAHLLDTPREELLARMQRFSGDAWNRQFYYYMSFAGAELNGQRKTLTELRGMARAADTATRKAAFEAELEASRSVEQGVANALNGLKMEANLLAELRGYGSVVDMTLAASRMERKTLDALWSAVEDFLPRMWQYLRRKAACMGYKNGLPWYELNASAGGEERLYTIPEAKELLVNCFARFSPDLAEMTARAFDEDWIDFYPRPGKSGGAFCRNLSNQKQSRVLTNYNGTLDSVVTIAHELGHAYHGQQIQDHRPLNRTYTMPVAETASNFNEALVMHGAIAAARGPQRVALIEQRLQDYTQCLCDIYSRFLFESAVVEQCRTRLLSPAEICALMDDAQARAYGDGLDPACRHPYMWVNKVHYYFQNLNFYNFPYTFGILFATGLYRSYQQRGAAFVPDYKRMLRATTVCTVEQAAAMAGVDVTDKAFWQGSLQVVDDLITEHLAATEPA